MFDVKRLQRAISYSPHPDPPPTPFPSLLVSATPHPACCASRPTSPRGGEASKRNAHSASKSPQLLLPSPFWTRISPPGELAARAGRPPHCVGRRVLACLPLPLPSLFFVKRPTPRPAAPPVPPGDPSRRAA